MGSSPTTTTVELEENIIVPYEELLDIFKKTMNGDPDEKITIRILPPKNNKSLYHHTRVHKVACPICDLEKKLSEKQMANGAGGRKKRRYRSIDDEWQTG